jgi:hypothetical protein
MTKTGRLFFSPIRDNLLAHMRNKILKGIVVLTIALGVGFVAWVWFTAPANPVYEGKRFSQWLYEMHNPGTLRAAKLDLFHALFREKGVEAAPLLGSWLATEHPLFLLRLEDLLRKYKLETQLLPRDRQEIAFKALDQVPLLGMTRAIQSYLLTDHAPVIRQKAAVIYVLRFSSAPPADQKLVAVESVPFISAFLDSFDKTGTDEYALNIISVLFETKAVPASDELIRRVRKAAEKSRFLQRAVKALDQ